MSLIRAEALAKRFLIARRRPGPLGALRHLLSRDLREVRAVDGISFEIERGEMVVNVGPNGAGKSTTIKMLTGILVPSSGLVEVAGLVPHRQRVQLALRIGVVFGQRTQLWWDLPLIDSLELLRHVYRVPRDVHSRNLDRFRELLELDDFLATPVRQLSLGQRMRGELAAALLHDPEIVYLDEPTIGLDVVAKHRIREFLRQINRERGVTVLLTTHDMSDIEQLCGRLMIVDHGHLIYDGGLAEIRDRFGTERTLVVDLAEDEPALDRPLAIETAVEIRSNGPRRWLRFHRAETTAADLIARVAKRYRIRDLTIEEPEIEEIIRQIYQGGLAPAPATSSSTTVERNPV